VFTSNYNLKVQIYQGLGAPFQIEFLKTGRTAAAVLLPLLLTRRSLSLFAVNFAVCLQSSSLSRARPG